MAQSLARGLVVLETLSEMEQPASLASIAKRCNLNRATTYRLLKTLKEKGYVQQEEATHGYRVGLSPVRIANKVLQGLEVRSVARPFLEQLGREFNETIHLMVRDGMHGVYIDKIESTRRIVMASGIGMQVPLHSSAVGKALLAFSPAEFLEEFLAKAPLPQFTLRTITDPALLKLELGKIRERGYAIDDEEEEVGIRCIGAPILNYQNHAVAALSIAGLTARLTDALIPQVAQRVCETAGKVSEQLGATLSPQSLVRS